MKVVNEGKNNIIEYPKKLESCNIIIKIKGNNNQIILADMICPLGKVLIEITGNDNKVILGKLRRVVSMHMHIKHGSSCVIGDLTSIEDAYLLADSKTKIVIGRDCMISFGVMIRTTDAHGIYSIDSGNLLNDPKDIFIGDHVWLGAQVIVSKGTYLHNNCVLGTRSYVSNKAIQSNSLAVGVPVRIIKENIIWDRRMTENIFDENANYDNEFKIWLDEINEKK